MYHSSFMLLRVPSIRRVLFRFHLKVLGTLELVENPHFAPDVWCFWCLFSENLLVFRNLRKSRTHRVVFFACHLGMDGWNWSSPSHQAHGNESTKAQPEAKMGPVRPEDIWSSLDSLDCKRSVDEDMMAIIIVRYHITKIPIKIIYGYMHTLLLVAWSITA